MSDIPVSISARFRVATPMFLGGFGPDPDSPGSDAPITRIRVPSIKGVLRFWWRAIQWHRLRAGAGSDEEALKRLHDGEQALFGNAADESLSAGGQSRVLMTARKESLTAQPSDPEFRALGYLLGQGLWDTKKSHLTRSASRITGFELRLRFHKTVDREQYESVVEALWILGLLGGLGARSRRGFGSLCLTEWIGLDPKAAERFPVPGTFDGYLDALAGIAKKHAEGDLPPFTAFSGLTRIDLSVSERARSEHFRGMQVLAAANTALMNFRRDGNNRQGEELPPMKRIIERDRKVMLGYLEQHANAIRELPQRSVFGLPHNYFFGSKVRSIDYSIASEESLGRRASPLFLHAHALSDGTCVLVHSMFPARFFPPEEEEKAEKANVTMKRGDNRRLKGVAEDAQIDWTLLHRYLGIWSKRHSVCGVEEEV